MKNAKATCLKACSKHADAISTRTSIFSYPPMALASYTAISVPATSSPLTEKCKSLSQYFDHIALSKEQIAEVTTHLKKIHESESLFHTESLTALRKEHDRVQKRINQIYEDKLDGLIDEKMYLDKVKDYKAREAEIVEQMARHEKADHNFFVTANMVMI